MSGVGPEVGEKVGTEVAVGTGEMVGEGEGDCSADIATSSVAMGTSASVFFPDFPQEVQKSRTVSAKSSDSICFLVVLQCFFIDEKSPDNCYALQGTV